MKSCEEPVSLEQLVADNGRLLAYVDKSSGDDDSCAELFKNDEHDVELVGQDFLQEYGPKNTCPLS